MPEKLDRCVEHVKAQGNVDNAWAVCNASLKEVNEPPARKTAQEANKKPYPPCDIVQPGDPLDKIEQEAVAISGGLSAQSVGAKRHKDQKVQETICPCNTFDKLHEALVQEAEDDTDWITVKGRHIPIKKGETKDEAVKKFLAKTPDKKPAKGAEKPSGSVANMSEKELVSGIKGGKKDWKEWYRDSNNEKFYAEIERRNKEVPKPKRPEGAGGTIYQDDPNAVEKYEKKIKYLEDVDAYWKKITKFPARDYHTRPTQLGDAKWYEQKNNSATLRDTKKKLARVKERQERGATLERKPTYKGGKRRFYYEEKPKEQETIDSNSNFDHVLNALRKETK